MILRSSIDKDLRESPLEARDEGSNDIEVQAGLIDVHVCTRTIAT